MPDSQRVCVRADLCFREGEGPTWRSQHMQGEPRHWPYGLEELGRYITDISCRELSRESLLGLVRSAVRRDARNADAVGFVRIAWDERVARRLMVEAPGERNMSGLIWLTDEAFTEGRWFRRSILARLLRDIDAFWVLSSGQLEPARELFPDVVGVEHLLFGVDPDMYRSSDYCATGRIVAFGNDEHRDWATYWRAAAQLTKHSSYVRVFGQGRRDQFERFRCSNRVEWLGRLSSSDVRSYYSSAAVVVVPTVFNLHASGMTVALEAMASGRPVVAMDTPGMRDYVDDGVTGFLVPCGDVDSVVDRVVHYLEHPDVAQRHGLAGRKRVVECLNTSRMCLDLAKLVGRYTYGISDPVY